MTEPTKPRLFDRLKLSPRAVDTTEQSMRAGRITAIVGCAGPKGASIADEVSETPPETAPGDR